MENKSKECGKIIEVEDLDLSKQKSFDEFINEEEKSPEDNIINSD